MLLVLLASLVELTDQAMTMQLLKAKMASRKKNKNIFSSRRLNSARLKPIATYSWGFHQWDLAQPKLKGLLRQWTMWSTMANLVGYAATRSTRSTAGICTKTALWRKAVFTKLVKPQDLYIKMTTKAQPVKALRQSRLEGRVKYMASNVSFTNHLPQRFKLVNSARSFWLVRLALTSLMS